jgi:crotonobetainyl-CoA:carnitine CoA-transferase CaiB-like acyl-CoA transferase
MLHSVSGLMALTGECGGGPVQPGQPVADLALPL